MLAPQWTGPVLLSILALGGDPRAGNCQVSIADTSLIAATARLQVFLPDRDASNLSLSGQPDSTAHHHSRLRDAAIGFAAGAAAGLVIAYIVDQSRDNGEGRLENYIAIPLSLGVVTFMTIFVAEGD